MQAPLARQVAKQLLPKSQPSIRPPLCSKCLQAIQIRNYVSQRHNTQKPKKTSSEFSSKDRYTISSRSDLSSTDKRLRDEFNSVFTNIPTSAVNFKDPLKSIEVIYPLIFRRELRSILDQYLVEISQNVFNLKNIPTNDIEQLRRVTIILNHCWVRSTYINLSSEDRELLKKNYADFIIDQTFKSDQVECRSILEILEKSLESQIKLEKPIEKNLIGAWSILRTKLGIQDQPKFRFEHDFKEEVEKYLREILATRGENVEGYCKQIENSVGPTTKKESLPLTLESIEKELNVLRRKLDLDGIIALWHKFKTELTLSRSESSSTHQPTTLSVAERDEIFALFLKTFKRSATPSRPLRSEFNDVLDWCPRPFSRIITQTLLALRAQPFGSVPKVGQEVISLDHEDARHNHSNNSLDNLKSIWAQSEEKDLKMYMIFMEALGRLGDLEALKEAWNNLIKDEKAKQLYLKEEKLPASTPFPPTQALNQMISSCLLIPDGPPIALDLFAQAALPNSSIPINLITINTILRHHARQADLLSMSSLFSLAEKINLKPDIITYTTLIQGLLRGNKFELVKKVFLDMSSKNLEPNERIYSMLISDLSKIGTINSLKNSEELLKLMIKNKNLKIKPNEITFTGLISGYFKNGWIKNGFDTIKRMENFNLKLNRIGYNILLKQFSNNPINNNNNNSNNEFGIIELWNKLIKDGITPNSDTYLLVLTPLVNQKKWLEADLILEEMKKRNFRIEKGALRNLVDRVRHRR